MKGKWKWVVIVLIAIVVIGSLAGGNDSDEPKKTGEVSSSGTTKSTGTSRKKSKKKNKFHVGDIVETPDLKITFISAKKYKCKNQFMQPKKGHIYYRMEFEFENKGDTDQTISSMTSWNCYADGYTPLRTMKLTPQSPRAIRRPALFTTKFPRTPKRSHWNLKRISGRRIRLYLFRKINNNHMMQGQGSDADSNDAAMASYCDSYKAPLCLRGFYHVCTKTKNSPKRV